MRRLLRLATGFVASLCALAGAPSAFAGLGITPFGMNFSGYLEQTSVPVDTNIYMEFQILANGTSLWCGEYSAVAVNNGYFSVDLGSSSQGGTTCGSSLSINPSALASVNSGTDMELSVEVSPDGSSWESFSNIPIASSLFALQADTAQNALNATAIAGVPVAPAPSPSPSQVLEYNGSAWVPADVASGGSAVGGLGAVQFSDGSGSFESNPSDFFWDSMNNRLGIGTSAPASTLNVTTTPGMVTTAGSVSIGEGAWDGSSSGHFNGNSKGTELAINAGSANQGDLANFEVYGASVFKVDYQGNVTATGTITNSGAVNNSGPVNNTGTTTANGTVSINTSGAGATTIGGGGGGVTLGDTSGGTTTIQGPTTLSSTTSFSGTQAGSILFTTTSNDVATDNAKLTWTDSSGYLGIGTTNPAATLDVNGAINQRGASAPSASASGQATMYFDSSSNKLQLSQNNGPYGAVGATVASADITDENASLSTTPFSPSFTPPTTGLYRVCVLLAVTSGASTTTEVTLYFYNGDSLAADSAMLIDDTSSLSGHFTSNCGAIYMGTSSPVTFTTSITGTATYNLHIRITQM